AGASFQTLVRNPLADPYVLGVSAGASVGAAVAVFGGLGARGGGGRVSARASAGWAGGPALGFRAGGGRGGGAAVAAALAGGVRSGVLFSAFAWAVVVTLASFARVGSTAEMLLWLLGSLTPPDGARLAAAAAAVVAGVAAMFALAPRMNALALGDEGAHSVGV